MKIEDSFNILDYIPLGHSNAVSRKWLISVTKLSDRTIRKLIEEANNPEDVIVNIGNGYFRYADETDLKYIEEYYKTENSRGWSNIHKSSIIKKFIDGKKRVPSELEKNQMSIYDYIGGE